MMIINPKRQRILINISFSAGIISIFLDVVFRLIITNDPSILVCTGDSNCSGVLGILKIFGYSNSGSTISLLLISFVSIIFSSLFGIYTKHFRKSTIIVLTFTVLLASVYTLSEKLAILPTWAIKQNGYLFSVILLLLEIFSLAKYKYQDTKTAKPKKPLNAYFLWLVSAILVFVVGYFVTIRGAGQYCTEFPLCGNLTNLNSDGRIALLHRLLVGILFIFTLIILNRTWLYYRSSQIMLNTATVAFTMLLGQSVIGLVQVSRDFPIILVILHAISAVVFLVSVVIAFVASQFELSAEQAQKMTIFNDKQRRKDFYLLNKPIIVVLLLITTYAGMVVAGSRFPSWTLTLWVIIAGALAAGGSSAINQFIDREIDLSMQRTAKRPIPSGRLMPAEGLALGIAEIVISFYIYVIFVNLLSGILAMAGMVYYVFVYSLWLKHATVQNIVIGGGAGAIPPLVGWAAVTGSLNVPSLFLFAIVFLWTPPHFWALALVRKNDYARAKVPMMPVINGEKKTRLQIFIYTIELVVLTLIMPIFHFGGTIYLISAVLLGIWILYSAWQVLTTKGNKVAYKMYRYSSMYLAFIFLALTIDALL